MKKMKGKVIIFSAPSGSGKSTIVRHILELYPDMEFSVSATSRPPRGEEVHGREYYFISNEEFSRRVEAGEFVEWEQVYAGRCYGTLKSEIERIWAKGHVVIFDVDVKGGVNLKNYFGDDSFSVFIKAPSIEELRRRLVLRGTDTPEAIEERVAKASEEMTWQDKFDFVLVNDDLQTAYAEAEKAVAAFLGK